MGRSECYCEINKHEGHSCEPTVNPNTRYCFDKLDGMIVNGQEVTNDIANCELKCRVHYQDATGDHNWQGSKHKRK